MAKHDDDRKKDDGKVDAAVKDSPSKAHAAHRDVQTAAHTAGSHETDAQRTAREEREKAAAESGGEPRMSPVNPRKPLDKEPAFAPGVGPNIGAVGEMGGPVPTDPRVPPENVTPAGLAPGSRTVDGAVTQTGAPAGEQAKSNEPAPIPTPAQAGLPEPHLRPGLDPLPEEEPTPSTVPIPPPGPRRVA